MTDTAFEDLDETTEDVLASIYGIHLHGSFSWVIVTKDLGEDDGGLRCLRCDEEFVPGDLALAWNYVENGYQQTAEHLPRLYRGAWCSEQCLYHWAYVYYTPECEREDPHDCNWRCIHGHIQTYIGCALPLVGGDALHDMLKEANDKRKKGQS